LKNPRPFQGGKEVRPKILSVSFYSFLINIIMSVVEAEKISKLEGRVEELSKRVDDIKSDINYLRNEVIATRNEMRNEITSLRNDMRSEINNLRNEMNNRIKELDKKLDNRFLWVLGVQITMWVTIILTILFK